MKADKDLIRELVVNAISSDYVNRNCNTDDIAYDTDFTEKYEISSVRLVTLVAQLEEEYGTEIRLSDMYRLHTVEQIADYVENVNEKVTKKDVSVQTSEKSLNDLFNEL